MMCFAKKTYPVDNDYPVTDIRWVKNDSLIQEKMNIAGGRLGYWKLAKAVSWVESHYNSLAISRTGCVGYMQLSKGAARDMGLVVNENIDERWNIYKNIFGGCKYIVWLHKWFVDRRYSQPLSWAVVSYNAGVGNVSDRAIIHNYDLWRVINSLKFKEQREYYTKVLIACTHLGFGLKGK
jgi:membrane-bound lytic murein transglycosylase MltF